MTTNEIEAKLRVQFSEAKISIVDLTGGGDHFRLEITSSSFVGKSVVEQHRMVYAALGNDVGGPIHALQLVTRSA